MPLSIPRSSVGPTLSARIRGSAVHGVECLRRLVGATATPVDAADALAWSSAELEAASYELWEPGDSHCKLATEIIILRTTLYLLAGEVPVVGPFVEAKAGFVVPLPDGLKLYEFQLEGVEFAMGKIKGGRQ